MKIIRISLLLAALVTLGCSQAPTAPAPGMQLRLGCSNNDNNSNNPPATTNNCNNNNNNNNNNNSNNSNNPPATA